MNNGSRINWFDIIVKLILIIVFVLLLVWLMPKNNVTGINDAVFRNNVDTMKDAAKSYYTKDRLPVNVGESSRLTLKQMIDKKMLLEFTDKNGKTCNTDSSYVEITKLSDSEYVLKVQLNCDGQQDYILETIGCYNVCKDGKCEVVIVDDKKQEEDTKKEDNTKKEEDTSLKTVYYQHRKPVYSQKTVYSCPEGYKLEGTKCTKSTIGATILATTIYEDDKTIKTPAKVNTGKEYKSYVDPVVTEKGDTVCPTGYTKNGNYCIKYTDATPKISDYRVECPVGYELATNDTECIQKYNATYVEGAKNYTCPNGGYLSGNICIMTTEPITNTVRTCPTGYTLDGSLCKKTYSAEFVSGPSRYTCPNGGTLNGTTCTISTSLNTSTDYTCPTGYTKNGTSCYKVYTASESTSYSCPSGYTRNGSTCTKEESYNATANTSYTCSNGELSGDKCIVDKSYKATASTSYSCPNGGTLNGKTCTKTETTAAKKSISYGSWVYTGTSYSKSAGGAYTGDTSKVVFEGSVSGATCGSPCGNSGIWYKYSSYSRTATTKYTCDKGTVSGSNCVTTSSYAASSTTSYSCPNGGTRSGTTCILKSSTLASKKTTYTCPNGGSLSGTKCIKTTTKNATATTSYSCPNGGSLSGNKCTITISATPSTETYCPSGYTRSGNQCIKTYTAQFVQEGGYFTCPNGGSLQGSSCVVTTDASYDYKKTCPTGYELDDYRCVKTYYATLTQGTGAYTCPNGGVLKGSVCELSKQPITTPIETYTCPTGYTLEGKKCKLTIAATVVKEKTYTCPAGYTKEGTAENTKCYKVTKTNDTYYCEDANAKLDGTTCVKTTKGGIKGYTCPTDYKLDGNKCIKYSTVSIDANASTKTETSYQYKWSTLSKIDGWEFTGKTKTEEYKAFQK